MRLNILIGGRAGQGINRISGIVSKVFFSYGYYTFNYRDYPSLIRGGHNFNVISISEKRIESHESKIDGIVAMDDLTIDLHKDELKENGFLIRCDDFLEFGINLNVALAGALMKTLGIDKETFINVVREELNNPLSLEAAEKGFNSQEKKYNIKKISTKRKLVVMTGNEAIAKGAIDSGIDIYFGYPMTPATNAMSELAAHEVEKNFMVFQAEDEISAVNAALGASFAGAKTMVGTSGGGFDLMTEALSMQGQTELPLVVYLGSRPGPGTGIPTYSSQGDLNTALRAGHGEFPRVVIAPSNPAEVIEKTNEAFYLAQKFGTLAIVLLDKHLAESEYSFENKLKKPLKIEVERLVPGEAIVKANSYEHDEFGNTTDDAQQAYENGLRRLKKYEEIKKACEKFEMYKVHGKQNSKNLIISWGSVSGAIKDAIEDLDFKFIQVIYMKPLSEKIKEELSKANKIILIENNLTGQLGRLLREKTGFKPNKIILKFDGRPFFYDKLKEELLKIK